MKRPAEIETGWSSRVGTRKEITMSNERAENDDDATNVRPEGVVNAQKVLECYAALIGVSGHGSDFEDLEDLIANLLVDLADFCGFEHDLILEDIFSSAMRHREAEQSKRPWPTSCTVCGEALIDGDGDNWYDLCPGCADRVSEYMDDHDLHGRVGRAKAVNFVRSDRRESE
jgi:hypothetical protein